ncbi:MAG: hypothetical protein JW867_06495, partial [Candidatus Omnitrophica bacterium]|nr:hypothetical protein [Candidatus Omnitrophota bacterium]
VLLIPLKKTRSKVIKKITCTGVIVRSERVTENGKFPYRVAMFFSDLTEPDRKTLKSYVNYSLKN